MNLQVFEKSPLVAGAGELWGEATTADFLAAIRDGTLPPEACQRWLEQDYLFAKGITTLLAIATAKTPRPAQQVLIQGLNAMDAELDWFEENLGERGLELNVTPHPICGRYVDFLINVGYSQPFEVLLAVLYGVEVSYLCAWSALRSKGPYAEFIDRWSSPPFARYVQELLDLCDQYTHPNQQALFDTVMRHERDFWRMTWEG